MTDLEKVFAVHLRALKCPPWVTEYRFHPTRRWRFDFAWPESMVAVEIDGGTWVSGRHNRPSGYAADARKLNTATMMGWSVLRYTREMVLSGEAARETTTFVKNRC